MRSRVLLDGRLRGSSPGRPETAPPDARYLADKRASETAREQTAYSLQNKSARLAAEAAREPPRGAWTAVWRGVRHVLQV